MLEKIGKSLLLFVFFFSWVACCSTPVKAPDNSDVKDLRKYAELFEKTMGSRVYGRMSSVYLHFGTLADSKVGVCSFTEFFGQREIVIDSAYWKTAGSTKKMALIFHEYGHCVCNLGHSWELGVYPEVGSGVSCKNQYLNKNGLLDDSCPKTIMFPCVPDDDCVRKHWGEYIKDLYNRCHP